MLALYAGLLSRDQRVTLTMPHHHHHHHHRQIAGRSAMHFAAAMGHLDVVRWLVGKGLPVDSADQVQQVAAVGKALLGSVPTHACVCVGACCCAVWQHATAASC